jgi:hypothetical protein
MFKDVVAVDLAVFLNSNEFAETHTINGDSHTIVVDNEELKKRSEKSGLYLGEIMYYVKASDMAKPKPDAIQVFDQTKYTVGSATVIDGLIEVILTRHGS